MWELLGLQISGQRFNEVLLRNFLHLIVLNVCLAGFSLSRFWTDGKLFIIGRMDFQYFHSSFNFVSGTLQLCSHF